MHVASGDLFNIYLDDGAAANTVVIAQSVNSGQVVAKATAVISGSLPVTIISGAAAFVDEVTVYNTDTAEHRATVALNSGALSGAVIVSVPLRSGQCMHYKPQLGWHLPAYQIPSVGSGAVTSGSIASGVISDGMFDAGSVSSANIASGQIGTNHFGSGSVQSGVIGSGQVSTFKLSSGSIRSGNIASGNIDLPHLASGLFQGLHHAATATAGQLLATGEAIAASTPVNISQSGRARVAMAGVSGRMPVFGISVKAFVSGEIVSVFSGSGVKTMGVYAAGADVIPVAAKMGLPLYCGLSGGITNAVVSGMLVQELGTLITSGIMYVNPAMSVTSGQDVTFKGTF